MKNILRIYFCIFWVWAATCVAQGAVAESTPGKMFDVEKAKVSFLKDLPDKEVQDLLQDSDGYLWIATRNGLFRYDGYKYLTFQSDLQHPQLISSNEIRVVEEDASQRIWFATVSGLERYDKRTGSLEHITQTGSMAPQRVTSILGTRDGMVWFGTHLGVWLYDPSSDVYTCITTSLSERQTAVGVRCLMEDSHGDIWIGTWDMGLFRYERSTGQIVDYPQINARNSVTSLCEDDQHRLWVGSWQCGIQVIEQPWDREHYRVTTFDKQHSGLFHDIIYSLCADTEKGQVLAGTPQGLTMFDTRQPSVDQLRPCNITSRTGMVYPGEQLVAIHKGRNGLYWMGMQGKGVCSIDPSGNRFDVDYQQDVSLRHGTTSCRSLLVDQQGKIYEGLATTGFIVRDTATGEFISWKDMPEFRQDVTMSTIESMIQSRRDGHIWMACLSMYILEFDPDAPVGHRATKYSVYSCPWLTSAFIYSIMEDHNANLWFGGAGNLSRKGADGSVLLLDTVHISDQRTIYDLTIYSMDEDGEGNIWLATQRDGLVRVSEVEGVWRAQAYNWSNGRLQADHVPCVHVDRKGRIWAGSASCGLHLYRSESDTFESVQQKWKIPGVAVNSIVEETASSLWLGTNVGIVNLSLNSEADQVDIRQFRVEDGLQDNIFNRNAVSRSSDGRIYMGGNLGYNAFYAKEIVDRKNELQCNLTELYVGQSAWSDMEQEVKYKISALAPEYTESICLSYNQNSLTIGFSAFDFVHPERMRYQYIMEGVDSRPMITEGSRHVAYYNNLPPGDYRFRLGSVDGDYVRSIRIHVCPPFWFSWWAYVLYVVMFIVSVYLSYRWMKQRMHRIQNLRMRVFERAQREKERVAELQASAIARTRDEMQQKFKQEQQSAADKTKLVFEAQEVSIHSSDEEFLRRALDLINQNLDNANYDQQMFIADMGVSKSTCFRKLKNLTGMGFNALLRGVRMNAACRILEEKQGIRVSELAYAVGYSDPRYFSTCFKKEYGMMPSEYADQVKDVSE